MAQATADQIIGNGNTFSLDVAFHVMLKEACSCEGSNFVFSPFSFHSMLCLVAAGAKGSDKVEHLPPTIPATSGDGWGPVVSFVNSAWVDRRFELKGSFEELARRVYCASLKKVDFVREAGGAEEEINSWVEDETKGLIKCLVPQGSLEGETTLVLANALYFKGQWDRKFDPSRTQVRSFHLLDSSETVSVPFMTTRSSQKHLYKAFNGYKVLKIPYQEPQPQIEHTTDGFSFSMHFFLPDENNGLPDLVRNVRTNPTMLSDYSSQLKLENLPRFWIPRFKFSFDVEGKAVMEELGTTTSGGFDFGAWELTEMVDGGGALRVSKMFHKAFIEVDEEGTVRKCGRRNPPSFVADHAFMFTIVEERSGLVLFVGVVVNPLTAPGEGRGILLHSDKKRRC